MLSKEKLQSCIQHCQTTAGDIRTMAADAQNPAKQSLDQAYSSIDACIKQCQDALNKI
ncbi:hypothetical protein ACOBQJ_10005 [Pelotomaculum propionicicum]|uniref:hypothetical protein n=1 Tax=Pelotomaculum propionicicum TaxID=258475 RepID=UPI003B76389B